MFRGDHPLTLDAKGRIAIPARHRERISELCAGALIITVSLTDKCLSMYPFPEWKRIEDDIQKLPTFDVQAQAIRHLLIGRATEMDMDSHGRILVPPALREWAELDKRVRLVGQGRKFEVWDEPRWLERIEALHGRDGTALSQPSEALSTLVL
mgnify:CR=1 FL=1